LILLRTFSFLHLPQNFDYFGFDFEVLATELVNLLELLFFGSGYVEPRGLGYGGLGRFAHDDLEYRSRFDRGTPFVQMADDMYDMY